MKKWALQAPHNGSLSCPNARPDRTDLTAHAHGLMLTPFRRNAACIGSPRKVDLQKEDRGRVRNIVRTLQAKYYGMYRLNFGNKYYT